MSWFRQYLTAFRNDGTPSDGLFEKADGTVWLRNPDGSETQVGSGGSQPAGELLNGGNVAIANNASANLTFGNHNSGPDLLDLTDPANPTVIAAGIYSVSVSISPNDAMTDGGIFSASLTLDANNAEATAIGSSPAAVTANLLPSLSLSLTYYIPAGGVIAVNVGNGDGVKSINFALQDAVVQRLS